MKLDNVQRIIELAKNEGCTELKYEDKEFKITVNFSSGSTAHIVPQTFSAPVAATQNVVANTTKDEIYHLVKSPFVGTFYGSASPADPSFVKVGDKVSPGKTLCILEAMKIMNEIEADAAGEIVEICVENESLVEYGQVLFKIRK